MKKKIPERLKILLAVVLSIFLLSAVYYFIEPSPYQLEDLSSFFVRVKNKSIINIKFIGNDRVEYSTLNGGYYFTYLPQKLQAKTISTMHKNGTKVQYTPSKNTAAHKNKWIDIIFDIIMMVALILLIRSMGGGMGSITKSDNSNPVIKSTVKFADVGGIDNFKKEVEEIIDFLKNPDQYVSRGIKIPKGLLLVGPPGTGKTLLAKAVAGESNVPFFAASGSDFVEMFVGLGAARVRNLFQNATKNSPAVIFIDEIDAIGMKRTNNIGSQESSNTLIALLTAMDGYHESKVVVIAATNLPDNLDPALLRPGRFDRIIHIPLPDINGRKEILDLLLKKIKIPHIVDSLAVARRTFGFAGADLTNLINESLFQVVRKKNYMLTSTEIEEALEKILFGISTNKKYELMEKVLVAYHEAGHALLAHEFRSITDPIFKLTIVNHGNTLGFLARVPDKEKISINKFQILANIKIALGGRGAEEVFFGKEKITSGASSDFKQATQYAINMVAFWGMTNKGMFFMDQNYSHLFSDDMKNNTYNQANAILDDSYVFVLQFLEQYRTLVNALVYYLLQQETLYKNDIESIINKDYKTIGFNSSLQIERDFLSPLNNAIVTW